MIDSKRWLRLAKAWAPVFTIVGVVIGIIFGWAVQNHWRALRADVIAAGEKIASLARGTREPPPNCDGAEEHWRNAEKLGTTEGFQEHLARFPTCPFAAIASDEITVRRDARAEEARRKAEEELRKAELAEQKQKAAEAEYRAAIAGLYIGNITVRINGCHRPSPGCIFDDESFYVLEVASTLESGQLRIEPGIPANPFVGRMLDRYNFVGKALRGKDPPDDIDIKFVPRSQEVIVRLRNEDLTRNGTGTLTRIEPAVFEERLSLLKEVLRRSADCRSAASSAQGDSLFLIIPLKTTPRMKTQIIEGAASKSFGASIFQLHEHLTYDHILKGHLSLYDESYEMKIAPSREGRPFALDGSNHGITQFRIPNRVITGARGETYSFNLGLTTGRSAALKSGGWAKFDEWSPSNCEVVIALMTIEPGSNQ